MTRAQESNSAELKQAILFGSVGLLLIGIFILTTNTIIVHASTQTTTHQPNHTIQSIPPQTPPHTQEIITLSQIPSQPQPPADIRPARSYTGPDIPSSPPPKDYQIINPSTNTQQYQPITYTPIQPEPTRQAVPPAPQSTPQPQPCQALTQATFNMITQLNYYTSVRTTLQTYQHINIQTPTEQCQATITDGIIQPLIQGQTSDPGSINIILSDTALTTCQTAIQQNEPTTAWTCYHQLQTNPTNQLKTLCQTISDKNGIIGQATKILC